MKKISFTIIHFVTRHATAVFLPKQMSVEEAEERYLDLVRRLSSFPETLRRSAIMNPFIAIHILFMNIEFRREYKAMVTAHVKK